jgi:hypothetical protein
MGEPSLGTPPSVRPPEDRLDSWKEIATYLGRDVTTVQRWEKREGMPLYRHLHDRMGSVYASRADLDAWMRGRNPRIGQEGAGQENGNNILSSDPPAQRLPAPISTSLSRWRFVLALAAVGGVLAIGVSIWLQRTEHFWRNPIADARFQTVTDFDGLEQAAAVSSDGHFVAFLSDRDGHMDVWVTQAGSGAFPIAIEDTPHGDPHRGSGKQHLRSLLRRCRQTKVRSQSICCAHWDYTQHRWCSHHAL